MGGREGRVFQFQQTIAGGLILIAGLSSTPLWSAEKPAAERAIHGDASATDYLHRARDLRERRLWRAAAIAYERAAHLDPATPAEKELGMMMLECGKPKHAVIALDRHLDSAPNDAAAFVARARAHALLGDGLAAAADYSRAIDLLDSPDVDLYLERALTLREMEESAAEAVRGLDEGIARLGPLLTLELAALELEVRASDFDAALARIDHLASASPRKEMWLARKGEILEQSGRKEEAARTYREAFAALASLPPQLRMSRPMQELEQRLLRRLR
ncbi:MAG TPA: hypothetical protein VMT00_11905 [Thermoanaerobaculia bacterium]|nr:hypothetical protein [Thermoanaerobaculia bacterium]